MLGESVVSSSKRPCAVTDRTTVNSTLSMANPPSSAFTAPAARPIAISTVPPRLSDRPHYEQLWQLIATSLDRAMAEYAAESEKRRTKSAKLKELRLKKEAEVLEPVFRDQPKRTSERQQRRREVYRSMKPWLHCRLVPAIP